MSEPKPIYKDDEGNMMIDQNEMTAQERVYTAVEARGYRQGWTAEQFVARQAVKLVEEVAEVADELILPSAIKGHVERVGEDAGAVFDQEHVWGDATIVDIFALQKELADVQVVLFCAADALNEVLAQYGEARFDVVSAAVAKAEKDIERGVRLSKVQENRQIDWEPGTAVEGMSKEQPTLTNEQWRVIRHSIFSHFWDVGMTLDEYENADVEAGDLEGWGIFNDRELHEATELRNSEKVSFVSILEVLDPFLGITGTPDVEHGLNVTEQSLSTAVAQVQAGDVHDVATLWDGVD